MSDTFDEIRQRCASGELYRVWQLIRRAEHDEGAALGRLAYELAGTRRYREFALDLSVDLFKATPEAGTALNLANVLARLGDPKTAAEIAGMVEGVDALKVAGDQVPPGYEREKLEALIAASQATRVNPESVLLAVQRARAALGF